MNNKTWIIIAGRASQKQCVFCLEWFRHSTAVEKSEKKKKKNAELKLIALMEFSFNTNYLK